MSKNTSKYTSKHTSMNTKGLINKADSKCVEIYLYGIIGKYMDIDTDKLVIEIEDLRKQGYSNFLFYVNSDGGEVVQGSNLFSYLDRTDINVTWVVDGIAASMMAVLLANPKHTVKASKYAKFMYHRVQGYVYGNSAEVRAHADMIDTFETSLIEMMSLRMDVSTDVVKGKFFTDGTDHWLSAGEAKELKLCDEIISGGKKITTAPDAALKNTRDLFNFYNNQIINEQKQAKMGKETNIYALALGMPDTEDESKVLNQMQTILNQNKTLTASLEAEKTKTASLEARLAEVAQAKVKNLLDQAIQEKKLTEDERATYAALAEKDLESVEKIINKLPGVTPVVGELGKPQTSGAWDKRMSELSEKLDK